MKRENRNFLSGFLLGAAAGAVVTVFLQSDKGQQLISNAKVGIKDASAELKNGIANVDGALENWLNKARGFLTDLRSRTIVEDTYDYDCEEIFS